MNTLTCILFFLCIIFSSCSEKIFETEKNNQNNDLNVNISIRVSDVVNDDEYFPIYLYIFNKEGECIDQQKISKEIKTYSTILQPGNYTISTFSGLDNSEYNFPESPVFDDVIEMKNPYIKRHPLMSGHYNLKLINSCDITVPIKYCVSALKFSLYDVPFDAKGVSFSISPLSNGYTFSGKYFGSCLKAEVECTFSNGLWEADPIFVFPVESSNVLLSIFVYRETGIEKYNYILKLEPAIPYLLKRSYLDLKSEITAVAITEGDNSL